MKIMVAALTVWLMSISLSAQTSGVLCEYWMGATLSDPADLVSNPNLLGLPTSNSVFSSFVGATNKSGGPFVARCTASLSVPKTGNYTFWIVANKIATLWIGSSATGFSGSGLCKVSASYPTPSAKQWTRNAEQKSALVSLTAGGSYYLQVVHVASSGATNHLAVGWQLPTAVYERPIPGTRLQSVYPVTVQLSADRTSLVQGQAATLNWSSSNATSCTASAVPEYQYWTGSRVTVNGGQYVTPIESTILKLTCLGGVGSGSASLVITVTAAEVLNPTTVQFDPSSDHNTALVEGYELQLYLLGAVIPFQTLPLGKPGPDTDGKIRVNFLTLPGVLVSWPVGVGQYQAKVSAFGSTGAGVSDFSNTFTVAR